jgi:hypothetical protein
MAFGRVGVWACRRGGRVGVVGEIFGGARLPKDHAT